MSDPYSDEYSEPEKQAAPEQSQTEGSEYWKAEAQKAFQARDQARQELRNQIQAGYDPQVVELVPPNLPPSEWKEYAEKLVAFRGKNEETVAPETSTEEPTPDVEVPQETLSGIVNGPSHSAQGGSGEISRADWMELVNTNPAEAERHFKADKVNMADLRQGLGPDR